MAPFLINAATSTTKTTPCSLESRSAFWVCSRILGCPGKSTRARVASFPDSEGTVIEAVDVVNEVCVFGALPNASCERFQLSKRDSSEKLTAEKRVVFPASGAPVSATVALPLPAVAPFEGREDPSGTG
jgi:hypothetical protein